MVGSLILFWSVMFTVVSGCKQPPYIAQRNVKYIPRSEKAIAEAANCSSPEHKPFYVINHWRNETILVCSCDKVIFGGVCPEVNIGNKLRIQESYKAPCHDFYTTPCPQKYNATQSHRYMECFEKFGGLSSPQSLFIEKQELREENQRLDKNDHVMKIIVGLLSGFLLLTWSGCCGFRISKHRPNFEKACCCGTSTFEESRNSETQMNSINHDQTTTDKDRMKLLGGCERQPGNEKFDTEDHAPDTDITITVTQRDFHDFQTEDMDESAGTNHKTERLGSQEIDDSLMHVQLYNLSS